MPDILKGTPETILVVDDEEALLQIAVKILADANFQVLSANSADGAITLAEGNNRIDLLLADVSLSPMSGPDLGEFLKKKRPDLHVMLMSGNDTGNLLVLNYGWAYIAKDLVSTKLVEMVKEVLNSPNRSQHGGQQFDTRKDPRLGGGH